MGGGRLVDTRGEAPPRHPPVERDIALVVAASRAVGDVTASITRHGGPLLRSVALFDVYRGLPLGADEKSLAYHLMFQAPDRTLTEHEVDTVMGALAAGLSTDVAGRLRT
jgi:phenylalanyl-tRNA synthetase beta chain